MSLLAFLLTAFAAEPTVVVGPELRRTALTLSGGVQEALLDEDWGTAADALAERPAEELEDWAFLRGWSLWRSDRLDEAGDILELLDAAPAGSIAAPRSYVDLLAGALLLQKGSATAALERWSRVPDTTVVFPEAVLARAAVHLDQKEPEEAVGLYRVLAERPDPAEGSPEALLALASLTGDDGERQALLRRVWWAYPRSRWSREAVRLMTPQQPRPTWQEVARRAEHLMALGAWDSVILETGRVLGEIGDDRSSDACRLLYARGRSFYKKTQLSNAIAGFGDAGERCTSVSEDYGAKALYLSGTASFRKRDWSAAVASFEQLAKLYPDHSMADDGYTQAGIALQEKGEVEAARARWMEGLNTHPSGDTVPEATFRLAFSLYQTGEIDRAREIARRLAELPVASDPVHVVAGMYWDARWAVWPDVTHPRVMNEAGKADAIARFVRLCEAHPHSFYAIQAFARLKVLAPDVAAELAGHAREAPRTSRPWRVRLTTMEEPFFRTGVDLARAGLIRAALAEWNVHGTSALNGEEIAWLTELRIANGDWLFAHDRMRHWMRSHPPEVLGQGTPEILRVGYPDRYWSLVQRATEGDTYEPRLFHALVREESNFNRSIRSHAGAIGLSQLMPATARQTAGWLGMTLQMSQLTEPDTNLKIGAHYLDRVLISQGGSPYLALAGYNAGSGRVRRWLTEWGNIPTDEYVERIPYRETRGYVKRVMGTWQTYRYAFDEGPGYADLSAYVDRARVE